MIAAFMDSTIMDCHVEITMINGRGEEELGQDTGGVFRDALSAFWGAFFQSCSIGEQEKVPALLNNFREEKWEAIAQVLVKGFLQSSYFPAKLSKSFLVESLFGRDCLDDSMLLESFMAYLSNDERELAKLALEDVLEDEHEQEWHDFLDNFGAKSIPKASKVKEVLLEMAHKELIQKPRFVSDCWKGTLSMLTTNPNFASVSALLAMYKTLAPTTKQVVKMMKAIPQNNAERDALNYLKRYIRGLEGDNLAKFLRFCTGGDVMCTPEIFVSFNSLEGAARRVVAHTCGLTLDVPTTYSSFPEFREEMDNILSSNFWDMDYV